MTTKEKAKDFTESLKGMPWSAPAHVASNYLRAHPKLNSADIVELATRLGWVWGGYHWYYTPVTIAAAAKREAQAEVS